jgi:hypothetical protein
VDTDAAILALKESLARPSRTPCTWRPDRDGYIEEQRAALLSCVIQPIQVQAAANSWAQQYVAGTIGQVRSFLAVARQEDAWLLFCPETRVFGKAFGSDASSLSLWGFFSEDALAEWLG